ncbi:MAG: protein kinase, partial [Planctomycetales bacterium]|nr:protein kinase [Planctomycetales bacterium]
MTCDDSLAARFISDELSDGEAAAFERHLDRCKSCRDALEHAASDLSLWRTTSDLLSSSTEVPCWRLVDTIHRSETTSSVSLPVNDLSMLAPSDEPNSLGRIGSYEISGIIGRGGMGIVLKAFDRPLNRNVAIKMLDPSLAGVAAARSRFAREARAMAAVSHEHLVPIYAVDEHAGLPYFAMEYVTGGTLEARLQRDGTLDTLSIIRVAHQVASALAAAHRNGLVHRDIKPANILLDRGTERVRVADFGLARVANDASHTRSGFVAGTPQYMSPEQVRGDECSTESDQFSLGCVMYAMCVGHSPFRSETLYGAMQRIVHDTPRSIRAQNPSIPTWLEQFVLRLLEKNPSHRFTSAQQIADLLSEELQYLQGSTSTSQPARHWRRANWRSNRLLTSFA